MIKVVKVGRIGLKTRDASRTVDFYTGDWGLGLTEEADGTAYLRTASGEHHAISLSPGDEAGFRELGLQVASEDELERAAEQLTSAGVAIDKAPGAADRPGAKRNLRLHDPAGLAIELYWGEESVKDDFGPREVKPRNLNHVVLRTTDIDRCFDFYREHFGFKLSDWNGHHMAFLRCNEIHHQLALVQSKRAGLHHVAFEVKDFMEIARGIYYLGDKGVPRLWGPGRHGAGNNLFSYFWDPEQNVIEYTSEIIRIKDDAAWKPRVWPARDSVDLWQQGAPAVMRD